MKKEITLFLNNIGFLNLILIKLNFRKLKLKLKFDSWKIIKNFCTTRTPFKF